MERTESDNMETNQRKLNKLVPLTSNGKLQRKQKQDGSEEVPFVSDRRSTRQEEMPAAGNVGAENTLRKTELRG